MRRNRLITAASLTFVLIVYAVLARLAGRPVFMGHAEAYWAIVIERFSVYGILGFLLSFLLPGRIVIAWGLVMTVAIALEFAQASISLQNPAIMDLLPKAAGGTFGVLLAQTILTFLPRPPA